MNWKNGWAYNVGAQTLYYDCIHWVSHIHENESVIIIVNFWERGYGTRFLLSVKFWDKQTRGMQEDLNSGSYSYKDDLMKYDTPAETQGDWISLLLNNSLSQECAFQAPYLSLVSVNPANLEKWYGHLYEMCGVRFMAKWTVSCSIDQRTICRSIVNFIKICWWNLVANYR